MKETLSSISKRLGYSTATISRVLNGKGKSARISEETQKIILDEAKRCKYVPNKLAQDLKKKKTSTIGLVLPSISNKYFSDIANVIIEEANKSSYTTLVVNYSENEEQERKILKSLISRRVDGIIISPSGKNQKLIEEINANNMPVVLIDRYFVPCQTNYVTTNNYDGGKQGTNILIDNGHKKIVCIQGVNSSMPNNRRVQGYIDSMKEAKLEEYIEITGNDFSIENGYLETKILLSKINKPDAIFALSNTIVLGCIKAIREAGLKIPEDISIVSYDDNPYLDYLNPSITRIGQMTGEMARLATKMLFDNIKKESKIINHLELTPQVIIRESVKNRL